MRQSLVVVPDASGLPSAKVPFPCMWDLVEYLSYQRVVVSYQYHATHFTVTFPRSDMETAQVLLDEWCRVPVGEMQMA
jgi:hypothetical protein